MVDFSADEILALSVDDLRELHAEITMAQPEGGLPTDAYLEMMRLMTAVEDMRAWSRLAEPGMAAWVPEDERAREMDRRSLDAHHDAARRFEELGGKAALERTLGRLNALDFED